MNLAVVIPGFALTIQLIALYFTIRLLRYKENRIISLVFVLAIFLMSFRRFISLHRFFSHGTIPIDPFAEMVAISFSLLILFGIILITRFLKSAEDNKRTATFNETLYHTLFNQSPDGVLLIDRHGDIMEFNDAVHLQLGYSREEFKTLRIEDIDPVESPADVQASMERVLKVGKDQFEVKHTTKQGEVRDVLVIIQRIELSGEFYFQTIWRDITESKKAAENLRESEDKFRSIFEEAIDGIMIGDLATKRNIEANKAICSMLGYTREELVGLTIDAIHPKEELPRIREIFEKQGRGEIFMATEIPMVRKDGSIFYADINSTSVSLGGKQCLIGIFRDITERRQAEEKLRKSDNQLRESQKVAKLGNWDLNLVSRELEWSEQTYRLFDKSPENFVPSHNEFARLVHPDDLGTMQTSFNKALASDDAPYHVAVRIINDSGREWVMEAFGLVRRDPSGNPLSILGTAQDITERKKAEEKIQEREEFIRNILDTVDEGFIVLDRDYRILTANSAYCGMVGGSTEEVIGRHCYKVSSKFAQPCYELGQECSVRLVFETGKPHSARTLRADAEGNILYIEKRAYPIKNHFDVVTSVIETISNITEQHLLEEERLKSHKLESIGTLAGGIAHDFNNLLQGVFGYISLAKESYDQKEKALSMLDQAEKALHLSVNLTNQLLTFSKGGKPVKQLIKVMPVVESAVKFALSGSNTNYELNTEADDLWLVDADEGQLAQVIQNIVLNANQAMAGGGTVRVALANADLAKDTIVTLPAGGRFVRITIRDSGIGINEQNLARIFDPYFTTKQKGSGLGLATSYSIIKNHGGMIEVKSEVNRGTTFTIYIPASLETKKIDPTPSDVTWTQKGRILLMDDEDLIREVAEAMILSLGHDIVCAGDGREAVALFREANAAGLPFDLVILDLTVKAGLGGEEALRMLREIDPEVKAVVSSGYADSPVVANCRAYGFSGVLNKPYKLEALNNCLNKHLHN